MGVACLSRLEDRRHPAPLAKLIVDERGLQLSLARTRAQYGRDTNGKYHMVSVHLFTISSHLIFND